jgi:mandelamide amidase
MNSDNLIELSAVDAVAAMQRGTLTAEEYASALLEQCERGKALKAFITLDGDQVLKAARVADQRRESGAKLGPLHGLPIPIKDSINTRDLPTTAGTPALRNFKPKEDAPIVRMLLEAGAIVLGKTNLHELSMGWTSDNWAFGAVRNPYDETRIAGGSSGGTAAAVAACMAPLGVAEDTEGSIRVPAALCGIAGFRPTTGRYPTDGAAPISSLFDQVGPHARRVSDLALFDAVITQDFNPIRPAELKGLKLGVARGYWFAGLDSEVERITSHALRNLQDAGVELVEAEVAELAYLIERTTPQVQLHDVLVELPKYLSDSGASVTFAQLIALASPELQAFFAEFGAGGRGFITEQVYRAACDIHLPRLRSNFQDYFARTGVAAIVFPATMVPATPIGQDQEVIINGKRIPFVTAIARNIAPGSTAGLPGLVLPAGLTKEGLPVALEFDGPAQTDRQLLALGLSVEGLLGQLPSPASLRGLPGARPI